MPKISKASTAISKLNEADRRLSSKLIFTLKEDKLDPQIRKQLNRLINRSRRGANAASPEVKKKYTNGYMTFFKQRFPALRQTHKQIDVTEAGRIIGLEWKALEKKEQQAYRDQAERDRTQSAILSDD